MRNALKLTYFCNLSTLTQKFVPQGIPKINDKWLFFLFIFFLTRWKILYETSSTLFEMQLVNTNLLLVCRFWAVGEKHIVYDGNIFLSSDYIFIQLEDIGHILQYILF